MFGDLFGAPFGVVTDPQQQRALSGAEISAMQMARANLAQQAEPRASMEFIRSLANFRREPLRPLDERFADFKARLAAAIARQPVKRDGVWEMPR